MTRQEKTDPTEIVEWDDEVTSLGRRVRQRGGARWIVQFRIDGRMRKRVIGDGDRLTREDARRAAVVAMERMRLGARVEEVAAAPKPFATVGDFGERYLSDLAPRWKPATQRGHRADFERVIKPQLGRKRVAALTQGDIKEWRRSLTFAPASVNRAMAVLSGMMRHAETMGLRTPGSNPCKGLRRRSSDFTAQYLPKTGYRKLGRALRALEREKPVEVALIRFLALTGCRRGEALGMEWDWVTAEAVRLPDSKTGPR